MNLYITPNNSDRVSSLLIIISKVEVFIVVVRLLVCYVLTLIDEIETPNKKLTTRVSVTQKSSGLEIL